MTMLSQILAETKNLPALPITLTRLYQLVGDDISGAAAFAKVIKPDAAVTANLLKLANSAIFGLRRQVHSIQQVVTLLGPPRVIDAVASASFMNLIPKRLPGYEIDSTAFWRHSVAVAILAEKLGGELKLGRLGHVFVAGLLHDIGKLAMAPFLGERSSAVLAALEAGARSFVEVERDVVGTSHDELGGALADQWGLPSEISLTARWHHQASDLPAGEDPMLVDLIHIADGLAHMLGQGADVGELTRQIDPESVSRLGFTVRSLERVASDALEPLAEMTALFSTTKGGGA